MMKFIQDTKQNAGFTLIEIVLVIAVIGIVSTTIITLVNPVTQFKKARDTQRKSDLHQIQTGLELYRADQGAYPIYVTPELPCNTPLAVDPATYIGKIPCDPSNTTQFIYSYSSDGSTYTLIACLENVNDPQRDLPPVFISGNNLSYCDGTKGWSYSLDNP